MRVSYKIGRSAFDLLTAGVVEGGRAGADAATGRGGICTLNLHAALVSNSLVDVFRVFT